MGSKENQYQPDVDEIYKSLQEGVKRRQQNQQLLRQQAEQQEKYQQIEQQRNELLEQFLQQERQEQENRRQEQLQQEQLRQQEQQRQEQQRQEELRQQAALEEQMRQEQLRQQELQRREQRRLALQNLELRERPDPHERPAPSKTQMQAPPRVQPQRQQYPGTQPRSQSLPQSPQQRTVIAPVAVSKQNKRVPRFYKVLLLLMVIVISAIFIGAYFFWGYMAAYEASLPEPIVTELLDNIDYDFWESKVSQSLFPLLTEFERDNARAVLEPYVSLVRDSAYTIRQKREECTDTTLVYILRAGARDIGIIRLISLRDAGYGFTMWEIESIEYLESFTDGFAGSISITASHNAEVSVNGIPVGADYSVPCGIEYGMSYLINNIFGDVHVTVTEWNGQVSSPYYAENGEYLYSVIRPFSRQFDIIAPNGVDIFINGERIPTNSITNNSIIPGILDGYLEPSEITLYSIRYQFEIEELYGEPEITAVDTLGRELISSISPDGQIIYSIGYSDELKEQHEETVEAFIRAYITYNANIGDKAQANFNELSKYIVRGSDLYNRAYASLAGGAVWAGGDSVTYNSLEIDSFMPYGDKYFTCRIRYNITNKTLYESREVAGNFEVIFVLTDGKWLAARMINI